MANKLRDELELMVGETKYVLRPSFEGLLEIEDKAGMGLLEIMGNMSTGKVSAKLIVAIIYGGIVGSGTKVDFNELGNKCLDHGFVQLSGPAAKFLASVIQSRQKKTTKE
jgi:hypothetical protein